MALIQRLKTGSYSVQGPLAAGRRDGRRERPRSAPRSSATPSPRAWPFRCATTSSACSARPRRPASRRGNDLRAGKRTALIEEVETRLGEREREPLSAVLGKADASESAVRAAMELLESSARGPPSRRASTSSTDQARAALQSGWPQRARATRRLEQLARMFAYRDADRPSRGSMAYGHGKVILLGEHSVVHGRPALALAVERGAEVTVVPAARGLRHHAAHRALERRCRHGRRAQPRARAAAASAQDRARLSTTTSVAFALHGHDARAERRRHGLVGGARCRGAARARRRARPHTPGRRDLRALAGLGARVSRQSLGRRQRHGHPRRHGLVHARAARSHASCRATRSRWWSPTAARRPAPS